MPSKSKKQHNLMAAVANSPKFAKKVGITQSVGEDYVKADKSKGKYNCGGKVHKMVKGGKVRGCGIARKGLTRGTMR